MIFEKEERHNGKKTAFSSNGAGQTGYLNVENPNKLIYITLHKTKLQLAQDLTIKPHTLNLIEDKVEINMAIPLKTRNSSTLRPSYTTPGHTPKAHLVVL